MGGNPNAVKGGTGKAEAAKLQDAGISPKQWPKKMSGRKRPPTGLPKHRARIQSVGAKLKKRKGGSRVLFEAPLGENLGAK